MARIVPPMVSAPGMNCFARSTNQTNQQKLISMKLVKLISLGLGAMFLGACASKPSQQPTVSTSSGSYVVPAK